MPLPVGLLRRLGQRLWPFHTTQDAADLAELIVEDFYGNKLDPSARGIQGNTAWEQMPEVQSAKRLRARNTPEPKIRRFLTFVSAMDRARDSNRLWCAATELFESHPEAFEPSEASAMKPDSLREQLCDGGVSQRHGPDSKAWQQIARSLTSGSGAVCRVVENGVGNAGQILRNLQSRRGGEWRFPLLRGPKIGPMWVRIMASPGGANIHRMDVVRVAVDVHVRQVTENLGVTDTRDLTLERAMPVIQRAWYMAVKRARIGGPPGIAGTCAALDPALWFFGKHGCSHCDKQGHRVPIGRACGHCRLPVSLSAQSHNPVSG